MDVRAYLRQLQDKGLYRELRSVQSIHQQYIYIDDKPYINFTSNDYLGIG